jgi:hypothetical protein
MTTSGVKPPATTSPTLPATPPVRLTQQAVNELRKLSGLTWEQLACLFDVSRRSSQLSMPLWLSGLKGIVRWEKIVGY